MLVVGTKVRIKDDLLSVGRVGCVFVNEDMRVFSGKVAKITGIGLGIQTLYRLDVDNGRWYWDPAMFDVILEEGADLNTIANERRTCYVSTRHIVEDDIVSEDIGTPINLFAHLKIIAKYLYDTDMASKFEQFFETPIGTPKDMEEWLQAPADENLIGCVNYLTQAEKDVLESLSDQSKKLRYYRVVRKLMQQGWFSGVSDRFADKSIREILEASL